MGQYADHTYTNVLLWGIGIIGNCYEYLLTLCRRITYKAHHLKLILIEKKDRVGGLFVFGYVY